MTELLELAAGSCRATIDPAAGGRLTSFIVDGRELMVQSGRDTFHWGSFVMAPWVGRLRDGAFTWNGETHDFPRNAPPHALHGLVTDAAWRADGPGTVSIELPEPWPWRGRVVHAMSLFDDHATFRLELQADEPMPAAIGWHPWFRRNVDGADVGIVLPAERMWQRDDDGIPDGRLVAPSTGPWDDCFTALIGPVELHWPGVLDLYVESDCEHVVVFDEPFGALCVEPQSAPPDAHNSEHDLAIVTPDEPLVHRATWTWSEPG